MLVTTERSCLIEYSCEYQNSSTHYSKDITRVKVLKKVKTWSQGYRVTKILVHTDRSCLYKYSCEVSKLSFSLFKSYFCGYSFQKVGQTPRSKWKGQNCWFSQKDVGSENTHVKYQSSSTHCSKVIIKINLYL